ncbi:FeoB-associated Cys-rich membrane protein [Selenomonas sp. TAMA-11512]|uniref:FeoB-associated Cys-rich membrane protein n=1 Tax=Selenomonas sp. TAMA-11512 TaxID=3095337 RepID=UPI0030CDC469
MSTWIVGALVAIALFFAFRHIWRNFREGKSDCYAGSTSCSSCQGGCASRHAGKKDGAV